MRCALNASMIFGKLSMFKEAAALLSTVANLVRIAVGSIFYCTFVTESLAGQRYVCGDHTSTFVSEL